MQYFVLIRLSSVYDAQRSRTEYRCAGAPVRQEHVTSTKTVQNCEHWNSSLQNNELQPIPSAKKNTHTKTEQQCLSVCLSLSSTAAALYRLTMCNNKRNDARYLSVLFDDTVPYSNNILHSASRRWSLTFWHRSFTFNSNKSPTWYNNFSVYYPDVCLQLKHVSGVFPPIIRSSVTAVAASGFTFVSWWQSCCVRASGWWFIWTLMLILQHFKHCPLQRSPPLLTIHRSQRFFHCWNASWNALSVIERSSLIAFSWISSMVWKRRPFKVVLTHWGRGHLNCLNCLNARSRGF